MTDALPTPLAAVVADRMRFLRTAQGLTQDVIARSARTFGLSDWTRLAVGAIEGHRRAVTLAETVLLPAIFATATTDPPQRYTLFDFLGSEPVSLSPTVHVTTPALLSLLAGEPISGAGWTVLTPRINPDQDNEAAIRVAHKLGISPEQLDAAAHTLWGQSLADEQRSRTHTSKPNHATKGHTTRALIAELAASLLAADPSNQ